jgi:hypothetical protein
MTDREIDVIVSASPNEISLDVHIDNVNPCEYPVLETLDCSYILNPSHGLSTKLLTCVLPSYDFSDVPTQLALTVPQKVDLATYLCDPVVIIQISAIYSNPLYNAALLLNAEYPDIVVQAIVGATPLLLFTNETDAQKDYNSTNIDYSVGARLTALVANTKWATNVLPYAIANGTCQQLNDNLTGAQRQVIQQVYVGKSGQTTSYVANDDGALQSGRGVDFFTLNCNNPSGNTNRFEKLVPNFITNWRDKTMIYKIQQGNQTWANMFLAIAVQNAIPLGGYNNWRAFNCVDAIAYACFGGTVGGGYYNYPPFLATVVSPYLAWTSNTAIGSITAALAIYMRNTNTWQVSALLKTSTYVFYLIRDF